MSELYKLHLDSNKLTGPIPSELGNLRILRDLYLHSNKLAGDVPSELGNLGELYELHMVAGNELTGCVPPGIGDVPSNDLPYSPKTAHLRSSVGQ